MPSTRLPGPSGKTTSRIGLGVATLMREGSRPAREKVFDAAYEAGVRHFDVAPLYGLGVAEKELGRLLLRVPADVTVATKFGLQPSTAAKYVAKVQGPLRSLLRQSPGLRSLVKKHSTTAVAVAAPSSADLLRSVSQSLDKLGLEQIDVLLLHDLFWTSDLEALWDQVRAGGGLRSARAVGVTGDESLLAGYPAKVFHQADVLQLPSSSKFMLSRPTERSFIIEYGLLSSSLEKFGDWLKNHDANRRQLERLIDAPIRSRQERAVFLATLALSHDDSSILLVGTTNPENIHGICAGVSRLLPVLKSNERDVLKLIGAEPSAPTVGFYYGKDN